MSYSDMNFKEQDNTHVNLNKLKAGNVGLQFFAVWINTKMHRSCSFEKALQLIDIYKRMLALNKNDIIPILSYNDVQQMMREDKIGSLLAVEGGDVLQGSLINLRILYYLGVRLLTLTWNYRNELADGVLESHSRAGLSQFGIEVVKEMNRLGMLIDVSHLSSNGFWDVLEFSKKPIVASHSNAQKICKHPRNLDDQQIRAISDNGGVIGINFNTPFLAAEKASIVDIIKHTEHIISLAGIDHVGFGSDFDGIDELPQGIAGPQDYPKIIEELLKMNYNEEDVRKICHNNFLRVIKEAFNVSENTIV